MKKILFTTLIVFTLFTKCSSDEESNCKTCKSTKTSTMDILCDNGDGTYTITTVDGDEKETSTEKYNEEFPSFDLIIKNYENQGATCK